MTAGKTQCLWCRDGKHDVGAHHAADCQFYRSPFVGPDADHWRQLLAAVWKSEPRDENI